MHDSRPERHPRSRRVHLPDRRTLPGRPRRGDQRPAADRLGRTDPGRAGRTDQTRQDRRRCPRLSVHRGRLGRTKGPRKPINAPERVARRIRGTRPARRRHDPRRVRRTSTRSASGMPPRVHLQDAPTRRDPDHPLPAHGAIPSWRNRATVQRNVHRLRAIQPDRRPARRSRAPLPDKAGSFESEPTVTGGIQIPGDAQPIILGVDRPTTGGYPLLACVIRADLPALAMLRPRDTVRFEPCTIDDARQIEAEQRCRLDELLPPSQPIHPSRAQR